MILSKCSWNLIRRVGKLNTFLIFVALILILHNELLCFNIVRFKWRQLPYSNNSIKILFVADPQLIGFNNDPWWVSGIARWDSDGYLTKGFREAMNHVGPDVVVFLGDLFDEGSSSTDLQFESYVKRFNDIFELPGHVKTVFIPGDNDIAEEGNDVIEQNIKDRFIKYFPSVTRAVTSVKFLDILKFDSYGRYIFQGAFNYSQIVKKSTGKFKIFCNHFESRKILKQVTKLIHPDLIVTGHTHQSTYVSCATCEPQEKQISHLLDQKDAYISIYISGNSSKADQIIVPSCNYRMGYPKMGYGFMELDYSGQVFYTVLWLPGRYPNLSYYVNFVILIVIVLILRIIVECCYKLFKK